MGDTKYGTASNIAGLERYGIKAFLPTSDLSARSPFYPIERFQYDPERNVYICPQGQLLALNHCDHTKQYFQYRADAATCRVCPVRSECTKSKIGRTIHRSFFQDELDRAASYRETEAYKKAMNKRKVWPEPLFGEAKQWHGLDKFRLRRLRKVNIEGVLIAAGQNIKRLLRHNAWRKPLRPAGTWMLAAPVPSIFPVFVGYSW